MTRRKVSYVTALNGCAEGLRAIADPACPCPDVHTGLSFSLCLCLSSLVSAPLVCAERCAARQSLRRSLVQYPHRARTEISVVYARSPSHAGRHAAPPPPSHNSATECEYPHESVISMLKKAASRLTIPPHVSACRTLSRPGAPTDRQVLPGRTTLRGIQLLSNGRGAGPAYPCAQRARPPCAHPSLHTHTHHPAALHPR